MGFRCPVRKSSLTWLGCAKKTAGEVERKNKFLSLYFDDADLADPFPLWFLLASIDGAELGIIFGKSRPRVIQSETFTRLSSRKIRQEKRERGKQTDRVSLQGSSPHRPMRTNLSSSYSHSYLLAHYLSRSSQRSTSSDTMSSRSSSKWAF